MPEPVIARPGCEPPANFPAGNALLRGAAIGFCGKIPARGDFVRAGLPSRFAEPWHDWLQQVLPESRHALAQAWVAAWNEAPIWRFALSPGICGPDPVLGLWMPSIDRVGRHFPLTFAAVAPDADTPGLIRFGGGFLAAAEAAGLDALARDLAPDAIVTRLAAESATEPTDAGVAPELGGRGGAVWWTDGGPRVPACAFVTSELPDAACFAGMLQGGSKVLPADLGGAGS
jgi:type VI secretion system protein ImpM